MPQERVMVGMSGGVDSSVCAALLQDAGYAVGGVTLHLYGGAEDGSAPGAADARAVCERLHIPHTVFDLRSDFRDNVIEDFICEYGCGRTPNPCIVCNRTIKFSAMLDRARALDCEKIATGHYAVIERDENGRYLLKKAADRQKDQTYVLYSLTQEQLSRTLFPLGGYTKAQVREIAEQNGFANARKHDSQDICFVPDGDYAGFIERETGEPSKCGLFLDQNGNRLGENKGVIRYTIGQRKGLGIALGKPAFVLQKNAQTGDVVLGDEDALFYRRVLIERVNFIPFDRPVTEMRVTAKLRYRHTEQSAVLYPRDDNTVLLEFDEPQRAPSPGQAAVFYDGDTVVGGGTIVKGADE